MKNFYKCTTLVCLLFFTKIVTAQHDLFKISRNSGVFAAGVNPALLANNKYKFQFSLGGFDISNFESPSSSMGLNNYYSKFFSKNETVDHRFATIYAPSALFSFGNGTTLAFNLENRNSEILVNPKPIISTTATGAYNAAKIVQYQNRATFSIAHGMAFKKHYISLGYGFVANRNDIEDVFLAKITTIDAKNEKLSGSLDYITISQKNIITQNHNIGIVYEFRPKEELARYKMDGKEYHDRLNNPYRLKLGISVTNSGGLASKDADFVKKSLVLNDKSFASSEANGIENIFYTTILGSLPVTDFTGLNRYQAMSHVFGDLRIGKKGIFLNGLYQKTASYNRFLTGLRFENKGAELHLGLSKNSFDKSPSVSALWRNGLFFLGAEKGLSKVDGNNFVDKNIRIMTGFTINIIWNKKKDRDNDQVSDSKDKCPQNAGLWVYKGCPDSDLDGIIDSEDECPELAGPASTKGCPDTDGDGIFDKNDACPKVKGITKFNGCPDTDNDDVPDADDECPTIKGLKEFDGCPDTDGDGIPDKEDACPNKAGSKQNKGCPQ